MMPQLYAALDATEDEIRLLEIDLSDQGQHKLLSNVSLRARPRPFVALSYPWGSDHAGDELRVNGEKCAVSPNLRRALHDVRQYWLDLHGSSGDQLLLWCDQICINQADVEEKGHQVNFMSSIYRRANLVFAWLPLDIPVRGNFDNWDSWERWHLAQTRLHAAGGQERSYRSPPNMRYAPVQDKDDSPVGPYEAWSHVQTIAESPWWRRAWVYQEFMLSNRLIFLIDGMAVPRTHFHKFFDTFVSALPVQLRETEAAIAAAQEKAVKLDGKARQLEEKLDGSRDKQRRYEDSCLHNCYERNTAAKQTFPKALLYLDPRSKPSPDGQRENADCYQAYEDTLECAVVLGTTCCLACCLCWLFPEPWRCSFTVPCFLGRAISNCCWECIPALPFLLLPSGPCSINPSPRFAKEQLVLENRAKSTAKEAESVRLATVERLTRDLALLRQVKTSLSAARFMLQSKVAKADEASLPLSMLIRHTRNCGVTDERDKIWSLLGLIDHSYQLTPNYAPFKSLEDVFVEAATAIIQTEGSLAFLNDAPQQPPVEASHRLPSWVPNMSKPDDHNTDYVRFIAGIQLPSDCNASDGEPPQVQLRADRHGNPARVLNAMGIFVCRLATTVSDDETQPWRSFADAEGRNRIAARSSVRVGDEVWVLLGADVPFVLCRPSARDDFYHLAGQAMIWEDGQPSPILKGALVERWREGKVEGKMVAIM